MNTHAVPFAESYNKILTRPGTSELVLKHCKKILESHRLREYPAFTHEPLLSSEDAKFLRQIIESNERHQYLNEEDSHRLKEILAVQMSTIEFHRKFLNELLKKLKVKRQNSTQPVKCSSLGGYETELYNSELIETHDINDPHKMAKDRIINVLTYKKTSNAGFLPKVPGCYKIPTVGNSCEVDFNEFNISKANENETQRRFLRNSLCQKITKLNYSAPSDHNRSDKLRNLTVFFTCFLFSTILVLSFAMVQFNCLDDF